MNYYDEIKESLINCEASNLIRDYTKNKLMLETYYNVGKLLNDAGCHYGAGIIKEYSKKLSSEIGKKYNYRTLYRMKKFYNFCININLTTPLSNLSWSHYILLIPIDDINKINYYMNVIEKNNLSVRQLEKRIKSNEYERLPKSTKNKLIQKEKTTMQDLIPNPIIIKSNNLDNIEYVSEKVLKELILQNLDSFLNQLGTGFTYVGNEYKLKINDRNYHIDLLLFNIKYNCYVVVELKVVEFKPEHIGQIKYYMNYVDKNIKEITNDKTIGIIICKKDNQFILEYTSDERISVREYYLL